MRASIRVVFVSVVVGCVVLTAFTCLFFAVGSSEKALSDTKGVRDSSVARCFEGSETSLKTMVNDVMRMAESHVGDLCTTYFAKFEKIVDRYLLMLEDGVPGAMTPPAIMEYARPTIWKDVYDNQNEGISALAVDHKDGYLLRYVVSPQVAGAIFVEEQLPAYDFSTCARSTFTTLSGEFAPGTNMTNIPDCPAGTFVYTDDMIFTCKRSQARSLYRTGQYLADNYDAVGPGKSRWGSLYRSAKAVTITLYGAYRAIGSQDSTVVGVVLIALSLEKVQWFLESVKIGSGNSRIFTVMRSDYLGRGSNVGILTGASHGEVWVPDEGNDRMKPIYPSESSDAVISELGTRLEAEYYSEELGRNITGYEMYLDSPNATEITLATTNESVYFCKVTALEPGSGFDWYLTIAIDRSYLLASTDELSASIRAEIDTSTQRVDNDIRASSIILYITVTAMLLIITAASTAFMLRVMRPLLALQRDMYAVSMLQLEKVHLSREGLSSMVEVRDMQRSFYEMFRNIEEYRSYMPASVLLHVTDDDDVDDASTRCSDQGHTGSRLPSQSSQDGRLTDNTHGSNTDNVAKALGIGDLRTRPVTYLIINTVGFLGKDPRSHEEYLNEVLTHARPYKGVTDSFAGDRIHLSWNALRPVSDGMHHAASFVWHLRSILKDTTFGLASSSVRCGNMGCASMRRFTYLGGLVQCASLLERLNKVYKSRVLAAGVTGYLRPRIHVKVVDSIRYSKFANDPFDILETMAPREVAEEEWMYQLDGFARSDPYAAYNSAVAAYLRHDYETAEDKLAGCTGTGDPQIEYFRERVSKRVQGVGEVLPVPYF